MRTVAKLCMTQNTHRNITSVFNYGHLSPFLYFIGMELCDMDLDEWIYRTWDESIAKKLPWITAVDNGRITPSCENGPSLGYYGGYNQSRRLHTFRTWSTSWFRGWMSPASVSKGGFNWSWWIYIYGIRLFGVHWVHSTSDVYIRGLALWDWA